MTQHAAPAEDQRYPIGQFTYVGPLTETERRQYIEQIAAAPANLRAAVKGLNDDQLNTPYRAGGWTVRQVVHHLPDSHMNAYVRFRLALTEHDPTIKTYNEGKWANLYDARSAPIEPSLALLEALHQRWVTLMRSLTADSWKRTFQHPEAGPYSLEKQLAMYCWHGRHHTAHVIKLRERMGW